MPWCMKPVAMTSILHMKHSNDTAHDKCLKTMSSHDYTLDPNRKTVLS